MQNKLVVMFYNHSKVKWAYEKIFILLWSH